MSQNNHVLKQDEYGRASQVSPPNVPIEEYAPITPVLGEEPCTSSELDQPAPGSKVPHNMEDLLATDEPIKLFGSLGKCFATFAGTGAIWVRKGKAVLKPGIPIRLHSLWHKWIRKGPWGPVAQSDPNPAPFLAIGDNQGFGHGIAGLEDGSEAVIRHVDGMWRVITVSKASKSHQGFISEGNNLRLTGYDALSNPGDGKDISDLKALAGNGIVVLKQIPAPTTCECDCACDCGTGTRIQTVANVLEIPSEGKHSLVSNNGVLSFEQISENPEQENSLF